MYWLKLGTQRFPIREGETTLGRSQYCSVPIHSASASREHAAVQFLNGALTLTDLDSRNGTLLNGRRITGPCAVRSGDRIDLGETQLTIVETNTLPEDITSTTEQKLPPEESESPTVAVPRATGEGEGLDD